MSVIENKEQDLQGISTQLLEPAKRATSPYLQIGTESSIIIRWTTDTPVQGKVWYGKDPDQLCLTQEETIITCNHIVKLNELTPDTKYYYAIGTQAEIQTCGTENYFFVTAPSAQAVEIRPLRILVLGDAGRGNEIAAQVRDGYLKFTGSRHTDLWLMLGDNAYDIGTYEEYQRGIFQMYPQLLRTSVLWTAIGNHDGGCANSVLQTGPYYELFSLPSNGEAGGVPSGTAAYYSFDYGNIHFICLDSYGSEREPEGEMLTWLKRDLALANHDWKIAFWHHPPYTKGSHDSDFEIELIEMREHVLPILEEAGVDIVLGGHSHSYERSYLINGHYGTSDSFTTQMKKDSGSGREDELGSYQKPHSGSHTGTVYIVAGTSALADVVSPHPAMYTSLSIPGSLVLDVQSKKLDVTFIDTQGEVQDYFTLRKC
ncbi:purple acid phosphatase family protein [Iningainema tapete]|uniref:Metallophosphoesterase family protein n=1 Tax=Iningainema tapete BLCC-T55 TaxID=2748662 RepID=A0A8J6XHK2_9CYAN|nr:metallophosphoesterase family protein [Iningainema tapete]MBD2776960.1 metallophosphoesterase family protein [Iningainema tapete BLCC-T55]